MIITLCKVLIKLSCLKYLENKFSWLSKWSKIHVTLDFQQTFFAKSSFPTIYLAERGGSSDLDSLEKRFWTNSFWQIWFQMELFRQLLKIKRFIFKDIICVKSIQKSIFEEDLVKNQFVESCSKFDHPSLLQKSPFKWSQRRKHDRKSKTTYSMKWPPVILKISKMFWKNPIWNMSVRFSVHVPTISRPISEFKFFETNLITLVLLKLIAFKCFNLLRLIYWSI